MGIAMEKLNKTIPSIIVPDHRRLEGFMRGIELWKTSIEYNKIYSGFKSIYDVATISGIHKYKILPGLAEMHCALGVIEQNACLAAISSEKYREINCMLRKVDQNITTPFVRFLKEQADDAKLVSKPERVVEIMFNAAENREAGSKITLARLRSAADMLHDGIFVY